ncbi:MAG: hypothetical protein ACTSQJ_15015 [Promethearchaeota archaeon]
MPKHNPKLDKPKGKKDKERRETYVDEYEYSKNYHPLLMAFIFIGVIVIIVVLFLFVFNEEATRISDGDEVKLDYDVYTLDDYNNNKDPTIHKTNKWVNVCSRYDDDCNNGLILGFYKELLGKKEGDSSTVYLDACIDKDKDGDDDNTGDDAESYGFPDDELFDEDIVIWYKVIKINKTSSSEGEENKSSFCFQLKNFNTQYLTIFPCAIMIYNKKENLI